MVCFPVYQSNPMKEPAHKKSQLCIDLDDTLEITMDSQTEKTDIKSGGNKFIKNTEHVKDKKPFDNSDFPDIGKIVTQCPQLKR